MKRVNLSRRKAREGALWALYSIDLGKASVTEAVEACIAESGLTHDLADYMEHLVRGVYSHRRDIDPFLTNYLNDYALDRLAAVDRNVLRMATYELMHVPEMPPAVTINEAIEIARKFSTAESGKFVNGVLGSMVLDSPKAKWQPPAVEETYEEVTHEPEPVVEEVVVEADAPEAKEAQKFGWVLRSGDREIPPMTS